MRIIETKSGAEIQIAPAPFKDAIALKNAIFKELAKSGVSLEKLDSKTNLMELIGPILQIDSSREVYETMFKCANRCLYNNNKIVEDTFEDISAREDYYFVMLEVLKENLTPFFKGLVSGLGQAFKAVEPVKNTPKSK